jgi:hypothetical protein
LFEATTTKKNVVEFQVVYSVCSEEEGEEQKDDQTETMMTMIAVNVVDVVQVVVVVVAVAAALDFLVAILDGN